MRRLRERLSGDRGGVAVIVALLMVPLLGFAAIAIDVAAAYVEKQQLQTGADAAALAIAEDCARGECPDDPEGTAQSLVRANDADADSPEVTWPSTNRVTVSAAAQREHWFAPVLGIDSSELGARASAAWRHPTAGTAELPLIFSWCEFLAQTDGGRPSGTTERTILMSKTSGTGCTGPSGNVAPGAFGWLAGEDKRACRVPTAIGETVHSDPGKSPTNGCKAVDFEAVKNQTILLPLFTEHGGNGSNAWYIPSGYAAFTVTGYNFGGSFTWNAPCSGADHCLRGYFTQFAEESDDFTYAPGVPESSAAVISLLANSELQP